MDEYKKRVTAQAEELVASKIVERLNIVQNLLNTKFAVRQPSTVRAAIETNVRQQVPKIGVHSDLSALVTTVGDEIEFAITSYQTITQWITLLVPRVADGNNFGVEVQLIVIKELKDMIEKLQKVWDTLPDYHSQRATVVEKLNEKLSKEKIVSTIVTDSKGGKEGDEQKSVKSTSDKDTTTTNALVDDWLANVVSIDVKWYFNLARWLEIVRDAYGTIADRIEKNKDKILLPRGHERASYSMY